jgi:hypothetical protein
VAAGRSAVMVVPFRFAILSNPHSGPDSLQ